MNVLKSDFLEAGTSSKSITDFLEFFLLQSDSFYHSQDNQPLTRDVDDHSTLDGNARPFVTLFWTTMVLSERTVVNYQRNFLVYGDGIDGSREFHALAESFNVDVCFQDHLDK